VSALLCGESAGKAPSRLLEPLFFQAVSGEVLRRVCRRPESVFDDSHRMESVVKMRMRRKRYRMRISSPIQPRFACKIGVKRYPY
jgi:hypothetical protein